MVALPGAARPALSRLQPSRTAIVHDWLPVYAGAERVLEQMIAVLPEADLHSLIEFLPDDQRDFLGGREVKTSFIQRLPFARKGYRNYLPFTPLAIEQFDLTAYDLVLSSSYVVAKSVLTFAEQLHVSYVHSPIRYAWDLQFQYLREGGLEHSLKGKLARLILHYMRTFDAATADRPDLYVANSHYVAKRIRKLYRRPAAVVHPAVNVERFTVGYDRDDYYCTCSRLVPYKKIRLIVEAFAQMPNKRLVVVGDGPEMGRLQAIATPNVDLLGHQPLEVLESTLREARAFVFAALEDFGIAPVEAQACGTPVIAYGRGGALETVRENETGIFFDQQTPEALVAAISRFEKDDARFDPDAIRAHAETFAAERFRARLADLLDQAWLAFSRDGDAEQILRSPVQSAMLPTPSDALPSLS
ncbi:MAG: glycosyltransferase family 4 protein [Bacteroidota bacterium]